MSVPLVIIRHMGEQRSSSVDPIDGAHLTGASRPSPPIHRYAPSAGLADLIGRYWIPVWSLPRPSTQSTLQHPVCLIVISNTYARFYGVVKGLSSVTLDGDGWAVGVMLRPAAGRLLLQRPVRQAADSWVPLASLPSLDGTALTRRVTEAMTAEPDAVDSHHAAIAAYESALRSLLPIDQAGLQINAVIDWLAEHPEVTRVAELATAFGLTERSLQRLVVDRVGLTPKWLIQRRRLHDAVLGLKAGTTSLADLAAELGYVDQAHFTRDFKTVTGLTPGQYLADQ